MYKNVPGQKLMVYAYNATTGAPVTADAANITCRLSKDGTLAPSNDTNPSELSSTHHPGVYLFDLTQAETNVDLLIASAVSSTSNVVIEPVEFRPAPTPVWCDIDYRRDEAAAACRYIATFRNGNGVITSGLTSVQVAVTAVGDASTLISATNMTAVGSTGVYRYDSTAARQTVGQEYIVTVTATYGGVTITDSKLVGRD